MSSEKSLSIIAMLLTLLGVGLLTVLDTQLTSLDFVSRLNEINAQYQFLANGLFLLIGVFWMGAIDTVRRSMEPTKLDVWLRFSVIAFAASYILSMVFPCDEGCPPVGSFNQMVHNTVVWLLYAGPLVFSIRRWQLGGLSLNDKLFTGLILVLFVGMQIDAIFYRSFAGLWQRLYELTYCWLWWSFLTRVKPRSD